MLLGFFAGLCVPGEQVAEPEPEPQPNPQVEAEKLIGINKSTKNCSSFIQFFTDVFYFYDDIHRLIFVYKMPFPFPIWIKGLKIKKK